MERKQETEALLHNVTEYKRQEQNVKNILYIYKKHNTFYGSNTVWNWARSLSLSSRSLSLYQCVSVCVCVWVCVRVQLE